MSVSIIIPYVRPAGLARCLEAVRANTGIDKSGYEIIIEEDKELIGVTKMVKRLAERAQGELICFLADDNIPQPNFLRNALRAMEYLKDGVGLVTFNEGTGKSPCYGHWLIHRDMIPLLGGEIYHTGYFHCYADDELYSRCLQMGRWIYAYDAVVVHDNPILTGASWEDDEALKKAYDPNTVTEDRRLFIARGNNNWVTPPEADAKYKPTAVLVGIPSGDMMHTDFALHLINMCIYSIQQGVQVGLVNQRSSVIEVGRNKLVESVAKIMPDYLLMLDSDMTFPPELLMKLLAHDVPMVCCNPSSRRGEIKSVLRGLDNQPVPMGQGLIEIKDGTTACTLIHRTVFERIEPPHFVVPWTKTENGASFLGEDYYFTSQVREAGLQVYCDTDIKIGHIGQKIYYVEE